ncbi:MAG: phenylalanine--tRNA ligase subunit alpha [Candidatus Thorarchaeota archaeon]|nr:phenylalanine--tRNA ligase subunit alpha [Candidatus Thorarchaeota archaeon]
MMEQLTEGEKRILQCLLDLGERASASEIADAINQNEERIVSILNALSERGLVELRSEESISFTITEEGSQYLEDGLPEVRLFQAVKELGGKAVFEVAFAKSNLPQNTKRIAMNWARKNGWLSISKVDGKTALETNVDQFNDLVYEVLQTISDGSQEIPEALDSALQQAIERTLVSRNTKKVFSANLRSEKRAAIDEILGLETGGVVALTPEMLADGSWKEKAFRPFNVELQPAHVSYGKKHSYAEFNNWLREILVGLGFTEWFGPYVETEFWNNDTLFVPQDHVAREVQDQFRVVEPYDHGDIRDQQYYKAVKSVHENGGNTGSKGWEAPYSKEVATRLCLRAHTTPVSMRYLWEHRESPQKMFIIDRNFRSESLSARHAQEFNQCEGIIMDKGLTLRNLIGYLTEICRRVGIEKVKYKPGQFPFTEPSVEVFAKHEVLGWIEVAPGGIFRPEVTHPLGITDPVLAWGIGSGRLYMASMGINDIRELYSRDLGLLRRMSFLR